MPCLNQYFGESIFVFKLYIPNYIVSSKLYDRRGNFDFQIFIIPFLDGNVPHSQSWEYIVINCVISGSFSLFFCNMQGENVLNLVASTNEIHVLLLIDFNTAVDTTNLVIKA